MSVQEAIRQIDEITVAMRESRDTMRIATATMAQAGEHIERADERIAELENENSLLKQGQHIPGEGWTREDGEEFFGAEALQMQAAWFEEKFKDAKMDHSKLVIVQECLKNEVEDTKNLRTRIAELGGTNE